MNIYERSEDSLQWHSDQRCNSIDPHDCHPEDRLVEPDKDKDHDSIEHGPKNSHGDANQNYKDMINYKLGILVCNSQTHGQLRESLGAFVLMETRIKLQLQRVGKRSRKSNCMQIC